MADRWSRGYAGSSQGARVRAPRFQPAQPATCVDPERVRDPMNESFRHFKGTSSYLTNEALESAVNWRSRSSGRCWSRASPAPARRCSPRRSPKGSTCTLLRWHVKSTTRAQDGLYVYDTVQRLYDSRFGDGDVKDIRRYIKLGPLGQAFAAEQARGAADRRGRQGGPRVPERPAARARPHALLHPRDGRRGRGASSARS